MASYTILTSPPELDPPTGLALIGGAAEVQVDLVPVDAPSLYQTEVQLTYIEDDWSHPVVAFLSPDVTGTILSGLREGVQVWVRARSNDKYLTVVDWSTIETTFTLDEDTVLLTGVTEQLPQTTAGTGTVV